MSNTQDAGLLNMKVSFFTRTGSHYVSHKWKKENIYMLTDKRGKSLLLAEEARKAFVKFEHVSLDSFYCKQV